MTICPGKVMTGFWLLFEDIQAISSMSLVKSVSEVARNISIIIMPTGQLPKEKKKSDTLTSTLREPTGLELRIPTRAKLHKNKAIFFSGYFCGNIS